MASVFSVQNHLLYKYTKIVQTTLCVVKPQCVGMKLKRRVSIWSFFNPFPLCTFIKMFLVENIQISIFLVYGHTVFLLTFDSLKKKKIGAVDLLWNLAWHLWAGFIILVRKGLRILIIKEMTHWQNKKNQYSWTVISLLKRLFYYL